MIEDEGKLAENEEVAAYYPTSGQTLTVNAPPKPKWRWDLLGDGYTIIVNTTRDISWWKRTTTRLIFGSKWKKLDP